MTFIIVCTLLILLRLGYCEETSNIFPPLLNISKSYVDVPPETSLTIECRGEEEVVWNYRILETLESEQKVNAISTSKNIEEETKYIALLYLPPSYIFTGLYTCSYKDAIKNDTQRNTSVYVFMNDPQHLFVPQNKFNMPIHISLSAESHPYIPCLPTNSKINVTLWQHTNVSNEMKCVSTNDMIMFNPTKGFLIREPLSRNFTCKGYWNGFEESTSVFKIQVPNDFVQKPFIERTSFHWYIGDNNNLNCSVVIPGNANSHFLKWIYPHINDDNTDLSEEYSYWENRYNYSILFLILNITTVEASHEGFYTCSLNEKNGNKTISKDQVYVAVYDDKPFEPVRFERAIDNSVIVEVPGNSSNFSVNVTNYDLEDIEIHWEKNGLVIQETPKYNLNTHSLPVSLSVNSIEMSDAGKYTIIGRRINRDTTRNVSFFLAVQSVPSVQILQPRSDRFYEIDKEYKLQCQAKSSSQSNITWMLKTCSSWDLCATSGKEIVIETSSAIKQLENSMYLVSSNLNVKTDKSGIYYCKAVNSIGENETSIPFIVTDIRMGLPTYLKTDEPNPRANTEVNIECRITSMVYENITWSFIQVPGNYSMMVIKEPLQFKISRTSYTYSEVSILSFEARRNRSGIYACTFLDKRSNNFTDKFIAVYIEAVTPSISTTPSPEPQASASTSMITTIVISVVIVAAVLIIIIIITVAVKIRRKNLRFNAANFQQGQLGLINPDLPLEDQVELLPYDQRWEFPKDRLKLGRGIGHGAFGRVVKADAIGLEANTPYTTVAVKMLKDKNDDSQYKALMAELKIMIHLGRHVNILNLMGAVTKNLYKGELMVMVEYCCHGNLRSYLLKHREKFINQIDPETGKVNSDILCENETESAEENRQRFDYTKPIALGISNPTYHYSSAGQLIKSIGDGHADTNGVTSTGSNITSTGGETSISTVGGSESGYSSTGEGGNFGFGGKEAARYSGILTTSDLLCYCFQCAQGMSYLASKKLLHRDLAARNILLAEGNVIKISDFGLSKDVYKYSKYVKKSDGPLPVKWMAIESIKDRIFTTKSDVWSFGILMWEIFTLGGNPYPGFEMNEGFFKRLQEGYRLEKPEYSPAEVYQIMLDCWKANPKDRPDFSLLGEQLGETLEGTVKEHYLDLNGPYSSLNCNLRSLEDYLNMNNANYLDMSASLQETNMEGVPNYINPSNMNSIKEKSHYYNIPPTIPEQVAIENTLDSKDADTRTGLHTVCAEIKSDAKDKDISHEENLSSSL